MSLADSLLSAVDDKSEVGKLLQGLLSNPFQLQALRGERTGSVYCCLLSCDLLGFVHLLHFAGSRQLQQQQRWYCHVQLLPSPLCASQLKPRFY
jgi:hypothetical protein